jgi:hypothetical protein
MTWSSVFVARTVLSWVGLVSLAGCWSPIALHRAMVEYDRNIVKAESELLLLNIARLQDDDPAHFTVTANIAATFDFRANAGLQGQLYEKGGTAFARNFYALNLGGSVAENPTISIVPVQGEEFTKRILTPLDQNKLDFLVHEGRNLQMVLRLVTRAIELEEGENRRSLLNTPARKTEYEEFRRLILHLSWLHETRQLFLVPLRYEERVEISLQTPPTAGEVVGGLAQGYRWSSGSGPNRFLVSRQVTGRMLITNVNPDRLPNEVRRRLNEDALLLPPNAVLVDILPEGPGGGYHFRGVLKLRSLHEMLQFLAKGIREAPEYAVDPDPRTGPVAVNPPKTLTIGMGPTVPPTAAVSIIHKDRGYWISGESDRPGSVSGWDRQAFELLYQIFQLTVTEVSRAVTPAIAISK